MILKNFRKPNDIKQGLKILIYGSDGCGKSLVTLGFPKIAYIDSEAKISVYENNSKYNKNIEFIMDTNNYNKTIEAMKEIISNKDSCEIETIVIDSETNIYETMNVVMMEVEEERARKKAIKKGDSVEFAVNDANVSQRAYGKIKNKYNSLKALRLQLSSMGINIITVAHLKELMDNNQNKIGETSDLRKGATHDYDVIIKCCKEKDIITQKFKFIAYIEKDTTETFELGEKVDFTWVDGEVSNIIYERLKGYIEKSGSIINNYQTVEELFENNIKEDEEFKGFNLEERQNKFKKIYTKLDEVGKEKAKELLKEKTKSGKISEVQDIKIFDEILNTLENSRV